MDADTQALIERLLARIAELEAENQALRQQLGALQQRLEQAERAAARQAAPFRRPDPKKVAPAKQKRPGQPKGHPGAQRAIPESIDEQVEVPLQACPNCGSAVTAAVPIVRYIEEIEPVRPKVTQVTTYQGECPGCGRIYSSHPLQTAPGPGGSKVQLGPRALAIASQLNKQCGLTMRKTCWVLQQLTGLRLTPGGLAQAVQRAARKLEADYDALKTRLRASAAVFADETSWWVGGPGWWLWTFTNDQATLYAVEKSRGSQVVLETLGPNFPGMLISDCLASYDPPAYRKHKCIAHHAKAIQEALKRPDTQEKDYLEQWWSLFRAVSVFWKLRPRLPAEEFVAVKSALHERVDWLLAKPVVQPGDVAVRNRLAKQRAHLLGCLDESAAEPTNNRAERALRPAVIARKLSCGNKTEPGKRAWEILASLMTTWTQHGQDAIAELSSRIRAPLAGAAAG
jgi:transposase